MRSHVSLLQRDVQDRLYIVTEYASMGDLHAYINAKGAKGLPEGVVWRLLLQTLLALSHMHSQKMLHRDIKSMNIFLGAEGTVKLGDLGVAKVRN
jgi:NIMA (never in mitosis gene a)-related kinase